MAVRAPRRPLEPRLPLRAPLVPRVPPEPLEGLKGVKLALETPRELFGKGKLFYLDILMGHWSLYRRHAPGLLRRDRALLGRPPPEEARTLGTAWLRRPPLEGT